MWIQTFIDYLRYERNLSERTVEGYEADLKAFSRFAKSLDETLDWTTIDEDIIRNWMMDMMEHGNRADDSARCGLTTSSCCDEGLWSATLPT